MVKAGKVKKGDGKEVNHIKPLSSGGSNADSNLEVISAEENQRGGQRITTKIRNERKKKKRKY
jgi:5-methylcytosine-specific restriction endonuclease McrA